MADYLDRMTARLVEQIANRSASFQSSYAGGSSFLPTNINGSPFRASNALTLAAEGQARGYTDMRWLTRQQAERLGATVAPDEVGASVQFWQMEKSRPTMVEAVVFNAEQAIGLPPYERQVATMQERAKAVEAVIAGSHAVIQRSDAAPGYDRAADLIRIPNRIPGDNPALQQQEIVQHLAAWTNHPSRIERAMNADDPVSATREQLLTTIAAMMVSDRLKIGYQGNTDPAFARNVAALDRAEIARAAMTGEIVAQEIQKFGVARQPELSQERMQELARQTLRDRAWQTANGNRAGHDPQRQGVAVVRGLRV